MNKKNILGIIAAVLIVGTLASGNLGFSPIDGAQSIGKNAWALLVYIGGGWLIYRAFKKDKPSGEKK
ncbi:MAG: hypothetical protein Q8O51_02100 [bacterium]|nr:hypothetical protein [bacterium]